MTNMMDLSVVIPTRNRAKMLADLLESLRVQESRGLNWEILVVDNNSTDDTSGMVESKKAGFPVPLLYIYEPNWGLHSCRNRGAKEANGVVVSFLDDDMIVSEQWIQGARLILEGQADLVGGRILPLWEASPPSWLKALFANYPEGRVLGYLGLIDLGEKVKAISEQFVFGGNCFVHKDVVFKLKGYHPDSLPQEFMRFRGDGESGFLLKFRQHKLVSVYDPIALAYHRINAERLTVDYFCKRSYNQGISDSFTRIRIEHKLYGELAEIREDSWKGNFRNVLRAVRTLLHKIYCQLSPHLREVEPIKRQGEKSHRNGYDFHQREVANDPKLLEWVLRENYLGKNGELPI